MSASEALSSIFLEVGIDSQSPSVATSDYETRQVVRFMNETGRDLVRRAEWSRLFKSVFDGGISSSKRLPNDFHRLPESGVVQVANSSHSPIRAVLAPEQWRMLEKRPSSTLYYHIRGGDILFSPLLPTEGVAYDYISSQWVEGDADKITKDEDETLIPERLIVRGAVWRYLRNKGLPYDDALAEFEADLAAEIKADRGAQ